MHSDRVRLSKAASHALRHAPWLYELELDDEGWTPVDDLLDGLRGRRQWRDLTLADIKDMVRTSDKQRFELRGRLIRARYGHSLPGKLKRTPARPPDMLYHGTSQQALDAIRTAGLMPMRRQYVHLSVEMDMAKQVARRKGQHTVILTIRAGEAHAQGVPFYEGNHIVWLADAIPPLFIVFPG